MHIPKIKSFFWETEKVEKLKNLHTEESLSAIEEQLLDTENNHYKHKSTQKYWLGGSSILTLLIITTVIYLTHGIIRKNCKTCNNTNLNIKENQCDRGRSLREWKEGRRERNTQKLNEHLSTNQFIAH